MTAATEPRVDFTPDRTHLLVCAVMTLIMLIPIGSKPLVLAWFLIIPAGYLWWILRAGTRVDGEGIATRYAFAKPRSARWAQISGVGFEKSKAVAHLEGGDSFTLPSVSFNDIPALSEASGGRITDALTSARVALDDMVTITRPDGSHELVTREEFQILARQGEVRAIPEHSGAQGLDTRQGAAENSTVEEGTARDLAAERRTQA